MRQLLLEMVKFLNGTAPQAYSSASSPPSPLCETRLPPVDATARGWRWLLSSAGPGAGMDPRFQEVPDDSSFCCREDKKDLASCDASNPYYSWSQGVNATASWCASPPAPRRLACVFSGVFVCR